MNNLPPLCDHDNDTSNICSCPASAFCWSWTMHEFNKPENCHRCGASQSDVSGGGCPEVDSYGASISIAEQAQDAEFNVRQAEVIIEIESEHYCE